MAADLCGPILEVAMSTSDVLREKALSLAQTEVPTEDAVRELLECCGDKRVPVVLARQQFLHELESNRSDPVVNRAAELLDNVLGRLPLG
jgi:hypothetical protein